MMVAQAGPRNPNDLNGDGIVTQQEIQTASMQHRVASPGVPLAATFAPLPQLALAPAQVVQSAIPTSVVTQGTMNVVVVQRSSSCSLC